MMIITIIFSRPQQYKMAKYCDEIFGELLLKVETVESTFYRNILSPKILWCIHFISQYILSQEIKVFVGRNLEMNLFFLSQNLETWEQKCFRSHCQIFPLNPAPHCHLQAGGKHYNTISPSPSLTPRHHQHHFTITKTNITTSYQVKLFFTALNPSLTDILWYSGWRTRFWSRTSDSSQRWKKLSWISSGKENSQ